MSKSDISWTEFSWNPLKVKSGGYGCTKVSPGCLNCYAGRWNQRFHGRDYDYQYQPTDFVLDEKVLEEPLRRKKPTTFFVASMCDLFHEKVHPALQEEVIQTMEDCPQHIFQVLTKRPDSMWASFTTYYSDKSMAVLPNVWLGVTAENQEMADARIPVLLDTPAAVRWVSIEPMIGPIVFRPQWTYALWETNHGKPTRKIQGAFDWIVVGGESGPGARPMHPDWVRSLRDQCVEANVPFFFKQWGAWGDFTSGQHHHGNREVHVLGPNGETFGAGVGKHGACDSDFTDQVTGRHYDGWEKKGGAWMVRVGKKAAGRLLDGRVWEQMPERRG